MKRSVGHAGTQNNFMNQYASGGVKTKMMTQGTVLSSNDSNQFVEERFGVGSTDINGKSSDPHINMMEGQNYEENTHTAMY